MQNRARYAEVARGRALPNSTASSQSVSVDTPSSFFHNKFMDFRWNDWNVEHIANHGVSPDEAEAVVRRATGRYPRKIDDDKWLVWGRGTGCRPLQVIFVLDEDEAVFVIHARPLTDREKRRFRRGRKR